MIKYIELNQLSSINMYIHVFVENCFFFVNQELHYQFNMNVDQSTRVIPLICTCKNVMIFDPAHEMPTLICCALFHHDRLRGWENESILDRIGGYIFC